MIKVYILVFIFLLIATVAKTIKHIEKRVLSRHMLFLRRWTIARDKRRQWLEDHPYITNGLDRQEYETLWLTEIGAEELLHIHYPFSARISYPEYKREHASLQE